MMMLRRAWTVFCNHDGVDGRDFTQLGSMSRTNFKAVKLDSTTNTQIIC